MSQRTPRAMYTGTFTIGETELPCAVLDDERRVFTQEGFLQAIGRAKKAGGSQNSQVDNLPPFLTAKNLQPFIGADLIRSTTPIPFTPLRDGGKPAYGYLADLLPEVCNVFHAARAAGALVPSQKHIADRCDILIRGFATVGIIALIDEATGYQAARRRNALNKILEAFIAKELMPWTKLFPDEFYREMFRLWGWEFNEESFSKRPGFAGTLTKRLVYEKMPPGVMAELQRINPSDGHGRRRYKHHQLLTAEIGHPYLHKHVIEVTLLMRIAESRTGFLSQFAKAYPTEGTQIYWAVDEFDESAAGKLPEEPK